MRLTRLTRSRRAVYLVAAAVVLVLLPLYLMAPDFLTILEAKIYDLHFTLRGARNPGEEVLIVAIDEKSLAAVGRWPWPRSRLAELVRKLSDAKVIALDILLSEPEFSGELRAATRLADRLLSAAPASRALQEELDRLRRTADHDAQLEAALRESGRVVLPIVFELAPGVPGTPAEPSGEPLKSALVGFRHYDDRGRYPPPGAREAMPPLPRFVAAARELGHVNMLADRDGTTRWEALVFEHRGYVYPSLGLQAARVALGVGPAELKLDFGRALEIGPRVVPVDPRNRMLVDYAGPAGTFRHVSAADVLSGAVGPATFRDRIVVVGATAAGVYDLRVTPVSPVFPAVEKHANIAANLLSGRFLTRPDWMELVEAAGIVLWPVFLAWLLPRLRPLVGLGVTLTAWGVGFGVAHAGFRTGFWIPVLYPSLAMIVSAVVVTGYLYVTEERRRQWVKRAFRQFVSPEVVERIAENPDALHFGGELRPLTVLFSDVRGFTDYTEKHAPDVVVQMLREHLTRMVAQIQARQGTLNQFLGDAVLALFGAPVPFADHAEQACRAARGMLVEFQELRAKWIAEGREPFRNMGIGINTGEMIVGNLGSEQLFNYTALGDGVNLGARLEALTKEFNVPIIISEATYQHVRDLFPARYLGEVKVKGKEKPVRIYALLDREEVRRAARVVVEAPLMITEADVSVPASLSDLSLTGLAAKQVARRIDKGAVVQVRLELTELPRPIVVEGRVMRSDEERLGIQFLELGDEDRKLLEQFLEGRSQQPPA